MSSSNSVSVTYVSEGATYGVKPDPAGAISIQQIRFTSESLSGTPITVESATIRPDRLSSGQVVTGLEVQGDISFELARDVFADQFFALAMMDTWRAATADVSGVSFTLDGVDDQRGTLSATGISAGLEAGDVLKVTEGTNIHMFQVITVTDADNLVVACRRGQADFVAGISRRPEFVQVGKVRNSVTIAKAYEDLLDGADEYSQTYLGSVLSGFTLNMEHGQIVTGSFTVMGNGYEQEKPSYQQQVVDGGGTVVGAPTSLALNASLNVPIVATEGAATDFCIMSLTVTLDNGMTPQNCIGFAAPKRYELGQANISISASIYNSAAAYDAFMPKKLTQEPISFTTIMLNGDGGYAFAFEAIQLSFPDGAASGANQQVMLELEGQAKVGEGGENALRIYRL
jgi:hypothetical protein